MEKYSRLISVSNRKFRTSETMSEIFLAQVDDVVARRGTELVPLVCESGVEMVLISPKCHVAVSIVESSTLDEVTAAA